VDLSELTGAGDDGVLLLGRLAREGVHLLGASPYVRLLLAPDQDPPGPPKFRLRRGARSLSRRRIRGGPRLRHRP
jgi:hypothetical protein